MIQLYHGDGKGKTTAAAGGLIRALGAGREPVFAQFMKGRKSGEVDFFSQIPRIRVLRMERDYGFFASMSEEEKEEARAAQQRILNRILEMLEKEETNFIVLDEITHACRYFPVLLETVKKILEYGKKEEGKAVEIILTGREPSAEMIAASDYISELVCRKHPFLKGVEARCGIEY